MILPARLVDLLHESKVHYEILRHFEAFTSPECAELEHVKGRFHAKVVIVKCGGRHLMMVLPTDHMIDMEKLESVLHKPVVIDSEDDLQALFPDCSLGKMPPFGKLYGMPTYIDKTLTDKETIVFEAGSHTDAIKMKMADYLRLAEGEIMDFSMKLHPMRKAA